MWDAWSELPQEERDEWLNKGTVPAAWRGFIDGLSPIPPNWVSKPATMAKIAVLKMNNEKAFNWGSVAGMAMGLFVGGTYSIKAGRVVADAVVTSAKGARRAASRAFNDFAKVFDGDIKHITDNTDKGQRILKASGETAEEAIERLSLQKDSLLRADQKMYDMELRFGLKKARELMKDELAERALADRKMKLMANRGGYYDPDVVLAALRRADLDPKDVYKNILEGDSVAKRQVVNMWQEYVTAPISNFLKGTLERAPGYVVDIVSGFIGGAASTFVYAFDYAYSKKNFTSEEALAFAIDAATDVTILDFTTPGAAAGTVTDFTEGGRYDETTGGDQQLNRGGPVMDPMRAKFYNRGGLSDKVSKIHGEGYTAPGQAYAIAKNMGYNRGGQAMREKYYRMSGKPLPKLIR